MKDFDYTGLSDDPKVIELLKERDKIEKQINELDEFALILTELRRLDTETNLLWKHTQNN